MTIGMRVTYSGRVQGVGFRYTTRHLAQDFPIAGHVRNLPDGRVEVLVEGERQQVDAFLAALERHMADYIEDRSAQEEPRQGSHGFVVRH